jgi:uncharacterized damage-inducible protein DinB
MTVDELRQELEQEAQTTRRVLERVPEDKLAWKPHPRSMSMGQLAMHVATLSGEIAKVSTQDSFDVDTAIPRPEAKSRAELMAALDKSLATANRILGEMADSALASPWKMTKGSREVMSMTRGALLRSVMLNHWYHHRAQLGVYLRLTGAKVPAMYGASADENPMAM